MPCVLEKQGRGLGWEWEATIYGRDGSKCENEIVAGAIYYTNITYTTSNL